MHVILLCNGACCNKYLFKKNTHTYTHKDTKPPTHTHTHTHPRTHTHTHIHTHTHTHPHTHTHHAHTHPHAHTHSHAHTHTHTLNSTPLDDGLAVTKASLLVQGTTFARDKHICPRGGIGTRNSNKRVPANLALDSTATEIGLHVFLSTGIS